MTSDGPKLCLFGAAPTTTNLGVSALSEATICGLARRLPGLELTVFDFRRSTPERTLDVDGRAFSYRLESLSHSRRYYRADNLWHVRVAGWLRLPGNRALSAIRRADAVLDLSAGDSFTDLPGSPREANGKKRFWTCTLPKLVALEQGRALHLLPQTYGPFRAQRSRAVAERVMASCTTAWARDRHSLEKMRELLGASFDESRHRLGVDMAFGLEPRDGTHRLPEKVRAWLRDRSTPLVGLNVSGFVFQNASLLAEAYALRADYPRALRLFASRLLTRTDCRLLLVPHVLSPAGHFESDPDACTALARLLPPVLQDRVSCIPPVLDHAETKGLIAGLDWFCGTRMHSTIAALSSGVPAAAVAYSLKFQGVFEGCGQGDRVADPRHLDTDETVEHLWQSWERRDEARARLRAALPSVREQLGRQLDDIAAACSPAARR